MLESNDFLPRELNMSKLLRKIWDYSRRLLPNKLYLKIQFYYVYHRALNINHPKTYADKLAYLKTHYKDERLSSLCDKYEVRNFVKKTIGEQYLVPLIGVYDSVDDIPWDSLPEKYVLKCTHDSQSIVLHQANEGFDRTLASNRLANHLKRNLFWYSREYPYKKIKPRIVCEEFLDDGGKPPADYKFMCFDGQPHYIVYDMDRFTNHHRDFYDLEWNKQNIGSDHEQGIECAQRPELLDEMINVAKKLSKGFPHVRVDLYAVQGKVYFGEMTFFPWGGPIWFKPDEWNYKLGELIHV